MATEKRMNPRKYIAQLQHVREISLVGVADLERWTEHLHGEGLTPAVDAGRAQIMISGIASKFMGVPFRELVMAVFTTHTAGSDQRDGAYLLHAFNSSRLLAWSERTLFSTPYVYSQVDVAIGPPATLDVREAGQQLLSVNLGGDPVNSGELLPANDELWEGPIYLPSSPGTRPSLRQVFFARLGGFTRSYAFDPARDSLTLNPSASAPVLQWLLETGFVATQWSIRDDAHHARSKTFRRSSVDQS